MDGTASSAQLALLGVTVTNVTPDNLKAVQNAIGTADPTSLTALQTAVDNAISTFNNASTLIANYANFVNDYEITDSIYPTPQASDYTALAITGMGDSGQPTVAMINSALGTPALLGTNADTRTDVQAIVDAYQVILDNANTASSTDASASDYLAIGVTGVDAGAETNLLGSVIENKATADVDSVADLQALANAVQAVMDGTASSAQLALLGVTVTNVTPDNLKAV
ncbi:hypothetical protein B472_16760, partial [Limnohabitans sp. Rim28]